MKTEDSRPAAAKPEPSGSLSLLAGISPWWLLALAAVVVLAGLGRRALWDDEAETALLARNVLAHGLPYASLGPDWISQERLHEIGWDGLWVWTPWVQIYTAAASFAAFGDSRWAARLPFALIGLAGLYVFYRMALEFFEGDRARAWLGLFFLSTSVPLLLQFRQCRGYSEVFLESLLWWWGYRRMIEGDGKEGRFFLVAGMVLLFHTQQLAFAAAALSFLAGHLAFYPGKTRRFVGPTLAAAALCAPWLLLQAHFSPVTPDPADFREKLLYYVSELSAHQLALALLLPWLWLKRREWTADPKLAFALLFLASYMCFLSSGPYPYAYRYLVALLVAAGLIQATLWRDILARVRRPAAGLLLLALAGGTNFFGTLLCVDLRTTDHPRHSRLDFTWGDMARELALPYKGPIAALSDYLNSHAKPSDVVWVTYGDLPLRYATGLRVLGGLGGGNFRDWPRPDWVVVRAGMIGGRQGPVYFLKKYILESLDLDRDYRAIPLDAPDIPWENRPDPDYHFFTTARAPPVVLYQRLRER